MKVDLTHDMYLSRPTARKPRPTPARDRADRPGITPDPNGTRAEREAWVRSRQLQPRDRLSFEKFLSIGEYTISCMYAKLEGQHERDPAEERLFKICRKAVEGYKRK